MKFNFDEVIRKKLVDKATLQRLLAIWRMQSKQIVFANGCFDILHPGHIHLLNSARSFGDILIAGLNTDESVRKIKPGRPVNNEESRGMLVASLEVVDAVILFNEETPLEIIGVIRPDVLVKGSDYQIEEVVGRDIVTAYGGKVELITLLEGYSTTDLIRKISRQ